MIGNIIADKSSLITAKTINKYSANRINALSVSLIVMYLFGKKYRHRLPLNSTDGCAYHISSNFLLFDNDCGACDCCINNDYVYITTIKNRAVCIIPYAISNEHSVLQQILRNMPQIDGDFATKQSIYAIQSNDMH